MHPHRKPRRGPRGLHPPGKRGAVGNQRSAGNNAVLKGLEDSAIHALRPAEVIRVDDQTFHRLYRFPIFPCPLGQLLVCATAGVRTIDRFRPQL